MGEESHVHLAGTTIHELAHTLAGPGSGHGPAWKAACAELGLEVAQAAGQAYQPDHFDASVWARIEALPHPSDGRPTFANRGNGPAPWAEGPRGVGHLGCDVQSVRHAVRSGAVSFRAVLAQTSAALVVQTR